MTIAIETFLARLRDAHPDMATIFLRGSCYELFQIMRAIWPDAIPWYVVGEGHVYVQIGRWYYDIRGRHRRLPGHAVNLRKPYSSDKPHRWAQRTHLRLVDRCQEVAR